MSDANYFSFQGKVYLGKRLSSGKPGPVQWVNDAGTLEVTLATEKDEKTESWSGQRMVAATLQKAKKGSVKLTFETINPEMLALGLYSKVNKSIAGTVTAEALPADLVAGDIVMLDHGNVTNLVISDSTPATPKTATLDTNYRLESEAAGMIEIVDPLALVQPFKAAYSYGASIDLAMFTQPAPERYLILDGINTVDGSRALVDLFRVKFNPFDALGLVQESFGQLPITGDVLFDAVNARNANLGGFGRFRLPGAA